MSVEAQNTIRGMRLGVNLFMEDYMQLIDSVKIVGGKIVVTLSGAILEDDARFLRSAGWFLCDGEWVYGDS